MKIRKTGMAVILLSAAMLFPVSSIAFAATSLVPASQVASAPAPLYGEYTYVGSDADSNYYVDPSSCYFSNPQSSVSALGCVIYKASKDANSNAPINGLDSYIVKYTTYTSTHNRVIVVDKVIGSGENITKDITANNSAFFDELFWKVANITGAAEQWKSSEVH